MNREFLHVKLRTWIAGLAVLGLLGTLAFATGAGQKTAATGTPWYADVAAPSEADHHAIRTGQDASASIDFAKGLSTAFRNVAGQVLPSVVSITNTPRPAEVPDSRRQTPQPWWGDEGMEEMFPDMPGFPGSELRRFFRQLPSIPEMPRPGQRGVGSGVIVDAAGVILTNNHVVDGDGKITVRLHDGREFEAVEIKQDPKTDIAVVVIEGADDLQPARLGDSDAADVGDWVLALGQPFGLEGTVTAGIISAKGRGLGIAPRENFLQTDAAINPGNSGGPLVNLNGEVIGINTAISSRTGGYQGVGFAVPINLAKWVGGQLVEHGMVRRAYLGVMIQPVTHQLAEQFGVKVNEGVVVTSVQPDAPAAKAGIEEGDVILKFDGKPVSNPRELQALVEPTEIGAKVDVLLVRDGKQITVEVVPNEQPEDYGLARSDRRAPLRPHSSDFDKLGLQAETLTSEVAEQLGVKAEQGIVITNVRPGSLAAQAGLRPGMVITRANHQPIGSPDDLKQALEKQPLEKGLLLLVETSEGARFVVLKSTG